MSSKTVTRRLKLLDQGKRTFRADCLGRDPHHFVSSRQWLGSTEAAHFDVLSACQTQVHGGDHLLEMMSILSCFGVISDQ